MDDSAPLELGSLVQAFLSAASEPQPDGAQAPVVAELAYGLDQAVSDFLDQHGLDVDAYAGVEQQALDLLAQDLQDQMGVNPDDLLNAGQDGYDSHAVLDAISVHWADAMADCGVQEIDPIDPGAMGLG